ncbi:MAG: hypothetical protein HOV80_27075 [Polyangiaceae bacterium]|nr:hypothetical protein [Polyangiaceae bacterium]
MDQATLLSLLAVLVLAALHVLPHGYERTAVRPRWLSAASGISVAYVFVHLLPELAEAQVKFKEARGSHAFSWFDDQIYVAALLGVVLALTADRVAATVRKPTAARFWVHLGSFALYNMVIGGFATRLRTPVSTGLAVIAFGAHFLVNDYGLQERSGRAYARFGRWMLAAAILLGWIIATASQPSAVLVTTLLGALAGGIIVNTLAEELPARRATHFMAFVGGALGYAVLLLALRYTNASV